MREKLSKQLSKIGCTNIFSLYEDIKMKGMFYFQRLNNTNI
jgi:hypothetical protein